MHRSNSDIPPMNPKTKKSDSIPKLQASENEKDEAFNFDDTDEFVPDKNFQFKSGIDKGWQPARQQPSIQLGENCLSEDSSFGAIPEELIDYT